MSLGGISVGGCLFSLGSILLVLSSIDNFPNLEFISNENLDELFPCMSLAQTK